MLTEDIKLQEELSRRLSGWINNPPDYYDTSETYQKIGELKAAIIRKKGAINRAEKLALMEEDRPRSNEAKKRKVDATLHLEDELVELEATLVVYEAKAKQIDTAKSMYVASTYALKATMSI